MAVSIIGPKFYAWDSDTGKPLAFGKVYTYQAGTNTPKATFTTEGGETQNANPVILNGAGYADIYLNGSYKIVVKNADDVEVWTSDPVSDPSQLQQEWVRQRNITQVNTTTFTVDGELTDEYVEGVAVRVKQDSGFVTGTVASATYADGKTTVTLDFPGTETITTSAVYAERALVSFQSLPKNLGNRTIYVGSVAELEALSLDAGVNVYLTEIGREGEGTIKSGTAPTDTLKGRHIVLANGNYWSRDDVRFIDPAWYGADFTGTDPTDPEWSAAIDEAIASKLAILPRPGTYKKTASTAKDNFTGLYVFGRGQVTIDFQVDDAFALGDFTQDGSGFFTQTAITCKDIVFSGVKFIPSNNGWDGGNFAYARPLSFSSSQNVHVTDYCKFIDNHVGAVDFSAPCKDIFIDHNHFESSQEAVNSYGPRVFCFVAPLDNLNETDGTLLYPAPAVYHENVNIKNNTFRQMGISILSWNVNGFEYSENYFRKPLSRTISATNWNFNGHIQKNKHIAEDNSLATLSTFINIGVGCENITVSKEYFGGSLSGTGINGSLKVIGCGGVSSGIKIQNNTFDTENAAVNVSVSMNVEIEISKSNRFLKDVIGPQVSPININNPSATGTPAFDFPKTVIEGNVDSANTRFVTLSGEPPTSSSTVTIRGNDLRQLMTNGVVASNATTSGWVADLSENDLKLGAFNYVINLSSGVIRLNRADKLEKALVTINTSGASVTLDWRDYGGREWYIVPDQSQTISDITNQISDGQRLTVIAGGTLTFPQGGFQLDGGANAIIGTNDSISFISRGGLWFETGRAAT